MKTFQDFSPYDWLSLHWNCLLDLEPFGAQWSALYGKKSCNVFIKNLHFFSTEERMTWTILNDMGVSKLSEKVFFLSELLL